MRSRQLKIESVEDLDIAIPHMIKECVQHVSNVHQDALSTLNSQGVVYLMLSETGYLSVWHTLHASYPELIMETELVKTFVSLKPAKDIVVLFGQEYYEEDAREALEAYNKIRGKHI